MEEFDNNTNVAGSANTSEVDTYEGWTGQHLDLSQSWVIVAIAFSCLAIGANVLSICAVAKVRPHLTPHFKLILNLAVSDTLIGASVMAHLLNQAFNPVGIPGRGPADRRVRSCCAFMVIKAFNSTGLNITLLNLFAMAIDHYVAIVRPLHHPLVMTDFRANLMIPMLWLIALLSGFSNFLTGFWYKALLHSDLNYCEVVRLSPYHEEYTVYTISIVSFVSMLVIYIRIYLQVKRRQAELTRRGHLGSLHRNKRALITTLLILGTFTLCWMPICLFQITLTILVNVAPSIQSRLPPDLHLMDRFLFNLLVLNAICDPIIYSLRMCEI